MTERAAELSSLKQEVAKLWSRYRKDEPPTGDPDGERLRVADQLRMLELKQRALADRRSALRSAIEAERRRTSAVAPVLRAGGAVVGVAVTALVVLSVMPMVAAWSLSLAAGHGALAVLLATLSLPVLLASR